MSNLTKSNEEASLTEIMSSKVYYSIPLFQREYVWKAKLVDELLEDFDTVADQNSGHFLGAIISFNEVTSASQSSRIDLIDGQQRLTTIFLFICAVVRVLSIQKNSELAGDYAKQYLFLDKLNRERTNSKLLPSLQDRGQLNKILDDLAKQSSLIKVLGDKFSYTPMSAPSNARTDGRLRDNYLAFVKFLKGKFEYWDIKEKEEYLDKILIKITVVQILIEDQATGPIIYNSLNGGQNPMTIGDLVRNSIFSRSSNADEMISLEETHWRPFIDGFRSGKKIFFDEYFFPYGLTVNQNLKKTDTFSTLQREWKNTHEPNEIIKLLQTHQACFMDLKTGSNRQNLTKKLKEHFKKLPNLGAPASTFPFIMQLMSAFHNDEIDEANCIKILKTIEDFLVRRAVVGIEPTGLHAVFKRLWNDLDGNVTSEKVKEVISTHTTVQRPSDDDFSSAVKNRKLAKTGICNFLLSEWNANLGGDIPETKLTVEHVLPQTFTSEWGETFTEDEHSILVHTFANLIPLSSPMNSSLQNSDYATKCKHYSDDSIFKAARELNKDFPIWTPQSLTERSLILAEWALKRWPYA